jgi:hypothetical protein
MWQWEKKAPSYNSTEYFHKYKWWLKREFLHKKINGELIDRGNSGVMMTLGLSPWS